MPLNCNLTPKIPLFAGKMSQNAHIGCNRHCTLIACRSERRILGQKPRNGGPKLLGRIPR